MNKGLEAIENANPSEALEDLKELHELAYGNDKTSWKIDEIRMSSHIKQALLKAQEQDFIIIKIVIPFLNELAIILGINDMDEMLDKIKEQEKVLEIIKEKNVCPRTLKDFIRRLVKDEFIIESYNAYVGKDRAITLEEFDLLKRCFK